MLCTPADTLEAPRKANVIDEGNDRGLAWAMLSVIRWNGRKQSGTMHADGRANELEGEVPGVEQTGIGTNECLECVSLPPFDEGLEGRTPEVVAARTNDWQQLEDARRLVLVHTQTKSISIASHLLYRLCSDDYLPLSCKALSLGSD